VGVANRSAQRAAHEADAGSAGGSKLSEAVNIAGNAGKL
jgi:hypothetical protein